MRDARKAALVGYQRPGYSRAKSIKQFKKTGNFKTVGNGSGHDAGYRWAAMRGIDHTSRVRKYSKNSPSFDEGVYAYKQEARERALREKMK